MGNYNFDEVISRVNTNSVKYDLRKLFFGTEDVIPMWVADMDFKTPDFVLNAIKSRLEHEFLGYTIQPEGFSSALIDWLYRQHNWIVKKEWVCFSPGVVPAINLCIEAFTKPGDKIMVQPPVYFPFFSAIKNNGRKLVSNNLLYQGGCYSIDFDDFEQKASEGVKLFILCNPHNPVGRVWTEGELREMATICRKHDVLILSDEIHNDLIIPPHKHIPLATLSSKIAASTITCVAPSKTFNLAGLATSSVIIENLELKQKYGEVLERVHIGSGNIFGFIAAEAAYKNGHNWLHELIDYIKSNIDVAQQYFETRIPEIKFIRPEATYLVWLDCSAMNLDNSQLKDFFIIKARVGLNDGITFGAPGKGFQRMNIACPRETLIESLRRIESAVNAHFNR